jgi:hypothetical protein
MSQALKILRGLYEFVRLLEFMFLIFPQFVFTSPQKAGEEGELASSLECIPIGVLGE